MTPSFTDVYWESDLQNEVNLFIAWIKRWQSFLLRPSTLVGIQNIYGIGFASYGRKQTPWFRTELWKLRPGGKGKGGGTIQPGPRLPPTFVKETERVLPFNTPGLDHLDSRAFKAPLATSPPCGGFVSHSPLATCYVLNGHFPFPPSSRTSQTQRTRAPGTASRTWPPSCPSCLGSRRTGWNCTIRTGTPPPPTHPTPLRGTFRLRCEEAQPLSDTRRHHEPLKGYT